MDVSDSGGRKWKLEKCRGEVRKEQEIRRRHKGGTRGRAWMHSVWEERMSGRIMSASREREDESARREWGAFTGEVQRTRSKS